jgi:hypothetical protein
MQPQKPSILKWTLCALAVIAGTFLLVVSISESQPLPLEADLLLVKGIPQNVVETTGRGRQAGSKTLTFKVADQRIIYSNSSPKYESLKFAIVDGQNLEIGVSRADVAAHPDSAVCPWTIRGDLVLLSFDEATAHYQDNNVSQKYAMRVAGFAIIGFAAIGIFACVRAQLAVSRYNAETNNISLRPKR